MTALVLEDKKEKVLIRTVFIPCYKQSHHALVVHPRLQRDSWLAVSKNPLHGSNMENSVLFKVNAPPRGALLTKAPRVK